MRLFFRPLLRLFLLALSAIFLLVCATARPPSAIGQDNPTPLSVLVEAIEFANLRAGPGIEYPVVGRIEKGTTYRMVGRSARYPWFLIAAPETPGWVYKDLVRVTGDIENVPYTENIITDLPATPTGFVGRVPPSVTPNSTSTSQTNVSYVIVTSQQVATFATMTLPPPTGITVEPRSVMNVRYGPGTDFPRVGVIAPGAQYAALRRNLSATWIEIAYPVGSGGRGWVLRELVNVTGEVNALPIVTDVLNLGYPTLTPTAPVVVTSVAPGATPPQSNNEVLNALGNNLEEYLRAAGFNGSFNRQATIFVMNLQTQHAFTINPDVAFSGASMLKIPVLVAAYRKLDAPPNNDLAWLISSMIVCSENTSANTMIEFVGGGNLTQGLQDVTNTMQALGYANTLLLDPFAVTRSDNTPTPLPPGFAPPFKTRADQISTSPDPLAQTTSTDLGFLMADIYQCAVTGRGRLVDTFPGQIALDECRQMMWVMQQFNGRVMIEAGLPAESGIKTAHKRGFINEVHGEAAVVMTPGGDYVLVTILRQPGFMSLNTSFDVLAEVSRLTYNTFNISRPLQTAVNESIPQCQIPRELVSVLTSKDGPIIR